MVVELIKNWMGFLDVKIALLEYLLNYLQYLQNFLARKKRVNQKIYIFVENPEFLFYKFGKIFKLYLVL